MLESMPTLSIPCLTLNDGERRAAFWNAHRSWKSQPDANMRWPASKGVSTRGPGGGAASAGAWLRSRASGDPASSAYDEAIADSDQTTAAIAAVNAVGERRAKASTAASTARPVAGYAMPVA